MTDTAQALFEARAEYEALVDRARRREIARKDWPSLERPAWERLEQCCKAFNAEGVRHVARVAGQSFQLPLL
jgi:hypothetical protein